MNLISHILVVSCLTEYCNKTKEEIYIDLPAYKAVAAK